MKKVWKEKYAKNAIGSKHLNAKMIIKAYYRIVDQLKMSMLALNHNYKNIYLIKYYIKYHHGRIRQSFAGWLKKEKNGKDIKIYQYWICVFIF